VGADLRVAHAGELTLARLMELIAATTIDAARAESAEK